MYFAGIRLCFSRQLFELLNQVPDIRQGSRLKLAVPFSRGVKESERSLRGFTVSGNLENITLF